MARQAQGDRFWIALICGWFVLQVIYRMLIGGALGLDEAQAVLEARELAWGYGPQPPLYMWLQWGLFRIVPDPVLALALLKNALLAGTCLAVWFLLRTAHLPRVAGPATLALMLVPQFAWESQRALTHSVLATCLAALTCLVFVTRTLPGKRGGWLLFGVLAGLGMIAKFNFAFVPPALLLAALSMKEFRGGLRPGGILVAGIVAALVTALPLRWMLTAPDLATGSRGKLDIVETAGFDPLVAAQGLGATLLAAALFLALPLAVTGFLHFRHRGTKRAAGRRLPPLDRFLWRVAVIGLVLVAVVVVASGATNVKDRWMQPVLFAVAPLLALWLIARAGDPARRGLLRAVGFAAALVLVMLPIEALYGLPGSPSRRAAPLDGLVPRLEAAFPDAGVMVADKEWLAGNLALQRPGKPIVSLDRLDGSSSCEGIVLVWSEDGPEAAPDLARQAGAACGLANARLGGVVTFAAPYRFQPEFAFELHAARLE